MEPTKAVWNPPIFRPWVQKNYWLFGKHPNACPLAWFIRCNTETPPFWRPSALQCRLRCFLANGFGPGIVSATLSCRPTLSPSTSTTNDKDPLGGWRKRWTFHHNFAKMRVTWGNTLMICISVLLGSLQDVSCPWGSAIAVWRDLISLSVGCNPWRSNNRSAANPGSKNDKAFIFNFTRASPTLRTQLGNHAFMFLRPYSTTNLMVIVAANCWKLPNISKKLALVAGPCVDQIRSRSKHNRHQCLNFPF